MRFLKIREEDLPKWHDQLIELEASSVYVLGAEAFRWNYGDDYFAFFRRLGEVHYYAMEDQGRLVAAGCGVLRRNPLRWHVSDVKVHPEFRNQHLPIRILRRAFVQNYLRCGHGYGISFNPPDGRYPPSIRALQHFKWLPVSTFRLAQLDIFSADSDQIRTALPIVSSRRGRGHFVSLRGVKDQILESNKSTVPLLHLRFGQAIDEGIFMDPQRRHTHMFCLPREHEANAKLAAAGIVPTGTATIAFHRMTTFDWSAIDTSEI